MKFCTQLIGQERAVLFDFRRIPSTDAPSSGHFVFLAFVSCLSAWSFACPSIIFKTAWQISMKFCIQLIGQERTLPFDFRWFPSTDAPSSDNFLFWAFIKSVIYETEQRYWIKFCTELVGHERKIPFDFVEFCLQMRPLVAIFVRAWQLTLAIAYFWSGLN